MAVKFKNDPQGEAIGGTTVFQSSVLHESVHDGRAKNPKLSVRVYTMTGNEDAGKVFEKDNRTYGKDIQRSNAADFINSYNKPMNRTSPHELL